MPELTPFQTAGPYLHLGLRAGLGPMTSQGSGDPIVIQGRLLDGAGHGISDGVLEFWAPGFDGMGRAPTDADGHYRLITRKPLPIDEPASGTHAPHFAVRVLARGILTEYLTRVYFDDEAGTMVDPVLVLVPADRRDTLVSRRLSPGVYRFDVVVQGEHETVFFDW